MISNFLVVVFLYWLLDIIVVIWTLRYLIDEQNELLEVPNFEGGGGKSKSSVKGRLRLRCSFHHFGTSCVVAGTHTDFASVLSIYSVFYNDCNMLVAYMIQLVRARQM